MFRATVISIVAIGLLTACGGGGERTVPQAQAAEENSAVFGDYTVYFHALSTNEVPAEVAQAVGIVRANNRAMLNVSIQETVGAVSVEADVSVDVVNLTGQSKSMTMRKVQQDAAIYYIGEVSVSNRETLIFDINVTPAGSEDTFEVRTKREYYTD
ncbi:MAG: DUF4426 domain-containing protein [Pseudomonadota bacterium]